jgi:ABC-2 type transport system ATP-binding protein
MDNAAISLCGLTKRFGDLVAVDSVDLEIAKGELFGLLGPNGAGKSTIIKMLTTMVKPSEGEARVWGHNVVAEKDKVRSSVGVVFQDPSVDSMLTGRENLDFHGRMYGMSGPLREERVREVLELVDLTDKADIKLEEYSGGMQRRLEIARGLMHHPNVLFLDEPTLGLDAQTRRYIWQYIKEMNQAEGVTVVLTTHYMDEADFLCSRVAIIDNGKIVALDTPKRLKDMIGADTITLEAQSGGDRLLKFLSGFDWIRSSHLSNGTIELMVDHAESRIPEIMHSAICGNVAIRSVSIHEPTLEDVFIKFTGKKIREAETANHGKIMARMWHRRK